MKYIENALVRYDKGQILVDSKPALLLAGEIHYFRLDPKDWQNRLDSLRECGMNTVSTYIPWLLHEASEGIFDFEGRTNERLNLKAFIELCEKNGFYLFLRPGPFIMAEMKNEGIPFWVYKNCPDAIPAGFDGEALTTSTLDYSEPSFLKCAKNWYRQVMGLIAEHTPDKGGRVLAVQLDNEIGMLSWVSGKPDLTPYTLKCFAEWLNGKYGDSLDSMYRLRYRDIKPDAFVSPQPPWDIFFHRDFAEFTRIKYERYVSTLKDYAEDAGVRGIQFVVNIHGTDGGRGFTYPIGVSQLQKTYAKKGDNIISGSDLYFHNMEMRNFQDMYLCNSITAASNPAGKPLTCVEFNCGDCNFGDNLNGRALSSSSDFKTRLAVAQGNRLINVYLFTGGSNYRLPYTTGDGNDRIASTGENHGFAAPIGPDGTPNQTYPRFSRVMRQIASLGDKFAKSAIQYDAVVYGFIPSYFATEYVYQKSDAAVKQKLDLEKNRAGNVWESTVRAFLLSGLALDTIDLENASLRGIQTLVLPSAKYMAQDLQQKVLDFVKAGGSLLLHGRVPRYDMDGLDCTILADALEVSEFCEKSGWQGHYNAAICAEGFLKGEKEFFCNEYETMTVKNAEPLLRKYDGGGICAFYKEIGKGKVIVISVDYKCGLRQYAKIKSALGIVQALNHDISTPGAGVFMTLTKTLDGDEEFLYLINMDDIDKDFNVYRGGKALFSRNIHLPSNEALTLPLDADFGFAKIVSSTLEILSLGENEILFRNTEKFSEIRIETEKSIVHSEHIKSIQKSGGVWIINTDNRLLEENVPIQFTGAKTGARYE